MSNMSFGKDFRLLTSSDFVGLNRKSKTIWTRWLKGCYKNSSDSSAKTRLGLVVSRKVGKAFLRNRVKRILRESFRQSSSRYLGKDVFGDCFTPPFCDTKKKIGRKRDARLFSDFA